MAQWKSPQSTKIKAVFFDVGGVLIQVLGKNSRVRARKRILQRSEQLLEKYFKSKQMSLLHEGRISELRFWQYVCTHEKIPPVSLEQAHKFLKFIFKPKKQTLNLAQQLKVAGYIVGIISNSIPPRSKSILKIYKKFVPCILSYEVKATKPSYKIFKVALQRAGVRAKESIFIDDRWDIIQAAKKFGFIALHYQSYSKLYKELRNILG